ncbi:3D-(3,5/4)-trihydroxycyclohexane-1,2-dione hydrolase [subsurface metagenome]
MNKKPQALNAKSQTKEDKWILSKLNTIVKEITKNLEEYKLGEAARQLYGFVWHEYADKYIETSKKQKKDVNKQVFKIILKLLHPFMPFITEHLWQMNKNKKPLIISGGGVARAEGWKELQEFAEYLQIPVITSIMGIGTISNESKCHLGISVMGAGAKAAKETDVILALGCKFSFVMALGKEPVWNNSQKMIQVDIDPTIIGRAKPITLGIISDCKLFLKQMLEEVKKTERVEKRDWLETLAENAQKNIRSLKKKSLIDKIPIRANRMVKEVLEFMDEDAILVVDGGNIAGSTLAQVNFYKARPPLSTLIAIGMGHLGTSVPYGIGVKLAKPDKQVITMSGDGSFMMNFQDLETAVRLGLKNLIYVIGNNSAWGMIKTAQQYLYRKRYIDTEFSDFDYGKAAVGFGCYGEEVTDPNEIKPALERAKSSGKPAVIDIKIKYEPRV